MPRVESDSNTNTVSFLPDEGSHCASLILMHGLGDSADGLSDLGEFWSSKLPYLKVVLPTAPRMSVTLNGGMLMNAWYDIVGLDNADRDNDTCEGITDSVARVRELVAAENALGIPNNRIILAGFSQGGAMSLFTGLQMEDESQKFAGLIALSGYLPASKQFKLTSGLETTPVLHCHGTADPVVR